MRRRKVWPEITPSIRVHPDILASIRREIAQDEIDRQRAAERDARKSHQAMRRAAAAMCGGEVNPRVRRRK